MITYMDAYTHPDAPKFLWQMMEESMDEPHTNISHNKMPAWEEHIAFLESRPRRVFLLIADATLSARPTLVGFVSITNSNEIGIRIAKGRRGRHYAQEALDHILDTYKPLPGLPSVRPGTFIANINPANAASIALFKKMGGIHIQNTYAVPNHL